MSFKFAAFAAAALFAAAPAFADDWDFIVLNQTGKPIKSFELSPAGAGKWSAEKEDPDFKRKDPIKAGGRTTVHFDKGAECKYDVKANFADDSNAVWTAINVCDNSFVTLKYANNTPTFSAN